jgi:hypothetical protein
VTFKVTVDTVDHIETAIQVYMFMAVTTLKQMPHTEIDDFFFFYTKIFFKKSEI